jgi:hypothetical protein
MRRSTFEKGPPMNPEAVSRRTFGVALLLAAAAFAAGCSSAPHVRSDREPGLGLHAYRSFAFGEAPSTSAVTLLDRRLRDAARRQLERHDLRYDARQPDLRVDYSLAVVDRQALQSAPGRRGLHGVETVDARQGTLAFDLVDTRRNVVVWRGVAEGRLNADAVQLPGQTIDITVGEIFARLDRDADGQPLRTDGAR